MVFQSTIVFIRFLSCMVHPTKSLASVGLAQARPNHKHMTHSIQVSWYTVLFVYMVLDWHHTIQSIINIQEMPGQAHVFEHES